MSANKQSLSYNEIEDNIYLVSTNLGPNDVGLYESTRGASECSAGSGQHKIFLFFRKPKLFHLFVYKIVGF